MANDYSEAKRLERKRIGAGWRYVAISNKIKILVPCDKMSRPTEEGMERIEKAKNRYLFCGYNQIDEKVGRLQ